MSYGLPYQGSKSGIVKDLMAALPNGERLVDLFCGGCSITDYALREMNKFRKFMVNDLNPMLPTTYLKALRGGFSGEDRWISREEFHRLKGEDPYVSLCFSFGNNCRTYLYGPAIEPYKRAIHHIVLWEDYGPMEQLCPAVVDIIHEYCDGHGRRERRQRLGRAVTAHVKEHNSVEYWQSNPMFRAIKLKGTPQVRGKSSAERLQGLQSLESLERLERLERLESLERLERLESLERMQGIQHPSTFITATNIDYREYSHEEGDVVYCDPPYANTDGYSSGPFDSSAFWEWARTREYPVYVSEYRAPDDFVPIWSKKKRSLFNTKKKRALKVEHLFVHRRFA